MNTKQAHLYLVQFVRSHGPTTPLRLHQVGFEPKITSIAEKAGDIYLNESGFWTAGS